MSTVVINHFKTKGSARDDVGAGAYLYVFDGQAGYLDPALANTYLAPQVVDAAIWHINAVEPRALDYNDFNQPDLYTPDQYRASDHDPILITLNLGTRYRIYLPITHPYIIIFFGRYWMASARWVGWITSEPASGCVDKT